MTFLIIIASSVSGQNCMTLNNFNTFHGVHFGQKFPDSLKKYFKTTIYDSSYVYYSMDQKELGINSWALQKWFHFGDVNFPIFSIACLPDKRVYEFELYKNYVLDDIASIEDSTEIVNNRLPKTFIKATDELTTLFGKMTKTENENSALGYYLYRIWECEKVKIILQLWYINKDNSMLGEFNVSTSISFTDKNLEKTQKLNSYKN